MMEQGNPFYFNGTRAGSTSRFILPAFVCMLVFSLYAQENLLKNGEFSDSSGSNWSFSTNGAQVTGKVESGKFTITFDTAYIPKAAPQLSQHDISFESGERYILSFKILGEGTGYFETAIENEGAIVYEDTNKLKIPISPQLTVHSIAFLVQRSAGTARLLFDCGTSGAISRIIIDSVYIVKRTTPVITITSPSIGTRWVAGGERQIVWQNSGTLPEVSIAFSADSGSTWNPITPAASNQKSYWWNIPSATAGDHCFLQITDPAGGYADTSAEFRIVAAAPIDRNEMVKNGQFLDTTNWRLSINGLAGARGSFTDDEFVIHVYTTGSEPWQVKLEQTGLTFENGSIYRFSYDAYASHPCKMFANVGADNGNPAWSVYGGDTLPVTLGTLKNRFTHIIIMKYPTIRNIRVEFNCGTDTGTIHIDNVSIVKVENTEAFIVNPSAGQALKSGTRFNIEWQVARSAAVDLDYSSDSGKTWTIVSEKVENTGTFSWNVPELSSEQCLIRIRKAGTDSVLGCSAVFQINRLGIIVRNGEMVANGTFSGSQQGWNISFDNASGQTGYNNQRFEIVINEPGDDLDAIILSQSGLPLLGKKEYTMSFDAFSNGNRDLGVALITDDTAAMFDTIVTLPSVNKSHTLTFTAATDALARIEFRMGGARAGVFIDNISLFTGAKPASIDVVLSLHKKPPATAFTIRPTGNGFTFLTLPGEGGRISIFSLGGALMATLPAAGVTAWDGRNAQGARLTRGSYVALLTGTRLWVSRTFTIR
jgi:hypothetical protein